MVNIQKSFTTPAPGDAGILYLVGTPIGNLEDITFRAIRTLNEVQLIAAEDTRQTRKLLTHFEIATRLVSYHEHNKQASGGELIRILKEGQSIALVSDAGLPAISDPGADLVVEAIENHIKVVPIPGANAALSALIISGMSTERFMFTGFPPRDKKSLHLWLNGLQRQEGTLMTYESPHRIRKTLDAMLEVWGDRQIAMVRELTKRFEEAARGTISECIAWLSENQPLGEYCLIIEGADAAKEAGRMNGTEGTEDSDKPWWSELDLEQHVSHYEAAEMDRKEAIKKVAVDRGLQKREVYNAVNR